MAALPGRNRPRWLCVKTARHATGVSATHSRTENGTGRLFDAAPNKPPATSPGVKLRPPWVGVTGIGGGGGSGKCVCVCVCVCGVRVGWERTGEQRSGGGKAGASQWERISRDQCDRFDAFAESWFSQFIGDTTSISPPPPHPPPPPPPLVVSFF